MDEELEAPRLTTLKDNDFLFAAAGLITIIPATPPLFHKKQLHQLRTVTSEDLASIMACMILPA
jgi:hypothetical protein